MDNQVITGAMALIKVKGVAIGKMKDVTYSEVYRRQRVVGIGTIYASEAPVTEFTASLSCSFMAINLKEGGVPNAIKRVSPNRSQVSVGASSFEDQLILDTEGVQVDIFKKISDVIDPTTGIIKPKLKPIAVIQNCMIESNNFSINEGTLGAHNQSFVVLQPAIIPT